jgi:hypothetical protein
MRPRGDLEGHGPGTAITDLALAGVETGLDAQSEIEQLVADIECAADRAGGAVEDGGDALLAAFDLATGVAGERPADHGVMTVDQLIPALVAEPDSMRTRLRHVGAEDCREHGLGGGPVRTRVRNSCTSPITWSASPKYGQWSSEFSARSLAFGMCSAK